MAKSNEIQGRRRLLAEIFRGRADEHHTADDLLEELRGHAEMQAFWAGFEARQRKSRQKPKGPEEPVAGRKSREKKPIIKGGLDVTSAVRLVQRDLEALEEQGQVEALIVKDGKPVVLPAAARKAQAHRQAGTGVAQPLKWRAGPALRNLDDDLEGMAGIIALDTVCRELAWLVPESLRDDLRDLRDRARFRIQRQAKHTPIRRWLAALRTESPSPGFECPAFDEDVREAIEQAIMQNKQLRLQVDGRTFEASVSQFIVKLPDRPVVEVWERNDEPLWPGGPKGPWCSWHRLETIQHAELLPLDADLSAASEQTQADEPYRARSYEFRASPLQMRKWTGTWLRDQLEVIGEDVDGWRICRYTDRGEPTGFRNYLTSLGPAVEVVKPLNVRASLAEHFARAAEMYRDVQRPPEAEVLAREDDEILATWGGIPRLVRPEWVPFTHEDLERLKRSRAWGREPDVIEGLCRLLCTEDPAGVCSPSNPHSATEYLAEVEQLFELLPTIHSEEALADAFRTAIHRGFGSPDPAENAVDYEDWEGIAGVAWLELTGFRVKSRGVPVR